jgi:proline dehydrogenase
MKEAQVVGAGMYPLWTEKKMTDVSYLACAAYLLVRGFPTHHIKRRLIAHTRLT